MIASIRKQNIISGVIAITIGALIFLIFNSFINKTVSRVSIKGVFPVNTRILVSTTTTGEVTRPVDIILVKGDSDPAGQLVRTKRLNIPFDRIGLKFGTSRVSFDALASKLGINKIRLQNIQIFRPYGQNILVDEKSIPNYFSEIDGNQKTGNFRSLFSARGSGVLVSNSVVSQPAFWKAVGLSTIFTLGLFVLFRNVDWASIPAFADMSLGREISSAHEFGAINGLRGIAALLVLLSHTAPGFKALGLGISLLFVISGFLLSKPFILSPDKIFKLANIEIFLIKRLRRILPMYYLYIFLAYVVALKMDVALRHFLFVQAEGHLWPMTQIFAFYMMLPIILIITSVLFKVNKSLPILVLTVSAYLWWSEMSHWQPFYNGRYFHEFFLYAFLMGVIASYLQYGFIVNKLRLQDIFKKWSWLLGLFGIALTILTIAWSAPIKPPASILPYISQFYIKCILCTIIMLIALNTQGTLFNTIISNWLFRSIGIVGFSFYILHGLGMQIVLKTQNLLFAMPYPPNRSWNFMLLAFAVTYVMSIVTYSYVERPFFGFRKTTNNVE